jgi:hypothetical protein
MKEKKANTALGELLLLIARDERIYRAMARLGESEVPFVLTGAISSLQQFLDEYGTPEAESMAQSRVPIPRKAPIPTTIFPSSRPTENPVNRQISPVSPKPENQAAPVATQAVPEAKPAAPPPVSQVVPPASAARKEAKPEGQALGADHVAPSARAEVPPAIVLHEPPRPPSTPVVEAPPASQASVRTTIPEEEPVPDVAPPPKVIVQKSLPGVRVPFNFDDQASYVHAVSLIPLTDSPSPEPFLLEEQGLDKRSNIFAVDHAGMRFFLSELNPDSYNVSKNGMLLLSKQDSLRLRGVHEHAVNVLRQYGTLLPAEFGTVVLGRDDLSRRVEFRLHALLEFVLDLGKTTTWRVTASVLDERVQRLLGPEPTPQRSSRTEPERGRHGAPTRRTDVKSLERVLTTEKKIAESVVDALASCAESHTVEQMVNLGSGRSEDWKAIVTATFMLGPGQNQRFFKTVLDVEAEQSIVDLMARVTGTTECFSLLM